MNTEKVTGHGVIVRAGGAEVHAEFHGTGKKNEPVTRRTRFRAASVSKIFTVFTLMQLVEGGRVKLDAKASDYLGFPIKNPNAPEKIVTVRSLASHTSGLRDGKIYSIPPNFSVDEFFKPTGKFYEGGAHFGDGNFFYSNLNYGLLGTIIEAVTGARFDVYQREHILAELDTEADYVVGNLSGAAFENLGTIHLNGRTTDFYEAQPARDTIALQNPYAEDFQGRYSLSGYRVGTNATIFSPQGGLRISFEELGHALEMLTNGGIFRGRRILSASSIAEMFTPHWIFDGKNGDTCGGEMTNYGLGTYTIGGGYAGHAGEAFGMLSGIFFRGGGGFVYMMNGEDFGLESAIRDGARNFIAAGRFSQSRSRGN